ncbi:hypothetical protein GW796_10715 [archaeon]|nr:hypothetical protein [archaeon]NCQ52334.1 hypothetical protein [archaeon]
MIFPAQKIKQEWFGDGSMRQLAPLSSSIHLGADKILIMGTGKASQYKTQSLVSDDITIDIKQKQYPSPAQISGHILNGLFIDSLYSDLERFQRTNEMADRFNSNNKNIDFPIKNRFIYYKS